MHIFSVVKISFCRISFSGHQNKFCACLDSIPVYWYGSHVILFMCKNCSDISWHQLNLNQSKTNCPKNLNSDGLIVREMGPWPECIFRSLLQFLVMMSMTLRTTKNMCCGLSVVFKITTRLSRIDVRKKSNLSRKNRTTGSPRHVRKIWDWPQPANSDQVEAEAELWGWQRLRSWAQIQSHAETTDHSQKLASAVPVKKIGSRDLIFGLVNSTYIFKVTNHNQHAFNIKYLANFIKNIEHVFAIRNWQI